MQYPPARRRACGQEPPAPTRLKNPRSSGRRPAAVRRARRRPKQLSSPP